MLQEAVFRRIFVIRNASIRDRNDERGRMGALQQESQI